MQIEPVQTESAPPEVRRIFDALQKTKGGVDNFSRMLAHKPAVLRAYNQLYGAVWGKPALPDRLKELSFLRVAILNGCEY